MTLTEEQRGTVGFDLEKARAEVATASDRRFSESREHARIFCAEEILPDALDEIERLRAFEMAARDLNNDLTRIAKERDEMATQIKKLKEDLEQAEICIRARLDVIDQLRVENKELQESLTAAYLLGSHKKAKELAPRIKELEDAHKRSGAKYAKIINELRSSVYANIPGLDVGKIGPDAETGNRDHVVGPDQMVPNGKVWQITEERKETLRRALEEYKIFPNDQAVLRAMLREAE